MGNEEVGVSSTHYGQATLLGTLAALGILALAEYSNNRNIPLVRSQAPISQAPLLPKDYAPPSNPIATIGPAPRLDSNYAQWRALHPPMYFRPQPTKVQPKRLAHAKAPRF